MSMSAAGSPADRDPQQPKRPAAGEDPLKSGPAAADGGISMRVIPAALLLAGATVTATWVGYPSSRVRGRCCPGDGDRAGQRGGPDRRPGGPDHDGAGHHPAHHAADRHRDTTTDRHRDTPTDRIRDAATDRSRNTPTDRPRDTPTDRPRDAAAHGHTDQPSAPGRGGPRRRHPPADPPTWTPAGYRHARVRPRAPGRSRRPGHGRRAAARRSPPSAAGQLAGPAAPAGPALTPRPDRVTTGSSRCSRGRWCSRQA